MRALSLPFQKTATRIAVPAQPSSKWTLVLLWLYGALIVVVAAVTILEWPWSRGVFYLTLFVLNFMLQVYQYRCRRRSELAGVRLAGFPTTKYMSRQRADASTRIVGVE